MFIVLRLFVVKDKEISAPQDVELEEAEVTKKRHLNVVFIGHVGELINLMFLFWEKEMTWLIIWF